MPLNSGLEMKLMRTGFDRDSVNSRLAKSIPHEEVALSMNLRHSMELFLLGVEDGMAPYAKQQFSLRKSSASLQESRFIVAYKEFYNFGYDLAFNLRNLDLNMLIMAVAEVFGYALGFLKGTETETSYRNSIGSRYPELKAA